MIFSYFFPSTKNIVVYLPIKINEINKIYLMSHSLKSIQLHSENIDNLLNN